jgi:hypothetical protein
VQLLVDPRTNQVVSVFHYAHGMEFRFDLGSAIKSEPIDNDNTLQFEGPNYGTDIDLVSHDLKFTVNQGQLLKAQNHILRLARDPVTGEPTHPVVYVEYGTHEFWPSPYWNYYYAPRHAGDSQYSYLTSTPPNLGEVEHPLAEHRAGLVILRFNGLWGTYSHRNSPPPGPPLHKQWTWPASSSIRWQLHNLGY